VVASIDPVNAAKAGWDIVQAGRPVANSATDYADALPPGADFTRMTGWSPTPRVERIRYIDRKHGVTRVDAVLACVWNYDGRFEGRGRYINHAHVAVARLTSKWPQKVDVRADAGTPINANTPAEPLAVLPVAITVSRSGLGRSDTRGWQASLRGDGQSDVTEL
jgi:hypothetical protein